MGYYTSALMMEAQKSCTIVFSWGNIATAPDIFQSKINQFMDGLDYVQAYLDNILIITKNTYEDLLNKLDAVVQKLHATSLIK
jgi:hypothetical protein